MEKLPWETDLDFLKYKFNNGSPTDRATVLDVLKEHLKTVGPSKQLEFIFEDD